MIALGQVACCQAIVLAFSTSLAATAFADDIRPFEPPEASIATSLPAGLADIGGHRAALAAKGMTYGIDYVGEVWRNTSGGIARGTVHAGRLELSFDLDLEKAAGLRGLTFHAHGYQIHGNGITTDKVGNFNALSNIEATEATRLLELWLERKFFGDRLSIRLGQLAADTDFLVSDTAGQFISASFGWPTITASNLPNGGPAYPFSTPGVRAAYSLNDRVHVMAGLYNDDPAGRGEGDPQLRNRHGLEFRISDAPFVIGELHVDYGARKGVVLPGTIKLGAWKDYGDFDDQRRDDGGLSLADPASSGTAFHHRGNHSFYAIIDQQLYQIPGAGEGQGVSAFARVMTAPNDRNLVSFGMDAGLVFSGFVPARPADSFGVAVAVADVSRGARALARDAMLFDPAVPARSSEVVLEFNYTAQIVPGWMITPDFQYVWNPGGNVLNDDGSHRRDAAVFGLRTSVKY